MATSDELSSILDRIASDTYSADDLHRLRREITVRGNRNMVQLGRYNVRMERGNNVHIGDRIYRGLEADAIRDVLADVASGQLGRGSLRGFSGFVITVGFLIALSGMAMFIYGLITAMGSSDIPSGPPPVLLQGFAIAFIGVVVSAVGQLIRGWEKARR
jgi:hypothetical protein